MHHFFYYWISLCVCCLSGAAIAANTPIEHTAPPYWWVNMQHPHLQVMLHGKNIAHYQVKLSSTDVQLKSVSTLDNPNYVFIDLDISQAKAQKFDFVFSQNEKKQFSHPYELKQRHTPAPQGLSSADVIYLLMPDRFANGNPKNDAVSTMQETCLQRDSLIARHGGDLQGVIDHLDYLDNLGITALWLNPVLTNDQPKWSYHGYAATDHYQIDPRFGDIELYRNLSQKAHQKGIKMVKDVIFNHVGDQHWFIKDLPSATWIHQFPKFTKTTYMTSTLMDPYASQYDKSVLLDGWFDKHMPDLNQQNLYVQNYLIQNCIWWTEVAQLDAFRLDTYAYSDPDFLVLWSERLTKEYPTLGLFGETWVQGEPIQAYFHGNTNINKNFNANMHGLTDFQLYYAINAALNENFGWETGVSRLYYTLVKDYLYTDATHNVTFLDNHDLSRYYSVIGEDVDKYKIGIGFLLTTRGIPCIYYGTEILMKNFANPDGLVRLDFVGGWQGDSSNKFEPKGRTQQEQMAFAFVQQLLQWRQNKTVIHSGKLMQFIPEKGVYTYFRYNDKESVMVMLNPSNEAVSIATDKFAERLQNYQKATDILTQQTFDISKSITVPAKGILIMELK